MNGGKRRCLMVVEDDPGLQKQLRWSFEDYDVVVAGDQPTALERLRRDAPAVVLQDLGLPPDASGTAEGFATIDGILEQAPHTKIIVVPATATGTTPSRRSAAAPMISAPSRWIWKSLGSSSIAHSGCTNSRPKIASCAANHR
jgi:CheY-like chemotaxis protein